MRQPASKWLVNFLLLVILGGLLIAYLAVVSDLPARVYTADQRAFLSYNYSRTLVQSAPLWNFITPSGTAAPGGAIAPATMPVQASRVRATLNGRYEEQEGVSATVYDLEFDGEYRMRYTGPLTLTSVELFFPFPSNLETLHEVQFLVDGVEPTSVQYSVEGIRWKTDLQAGEERQIVIGYQATGANSFAYGLSRDQRSDVDVTVTVQGLTGSETPRASLTPSSVQSAADGETFTWSYTGLIANRDVRLNLPTRQSFAQRVTQLQPKFRTLAVVAPFLIILFLASLAGLLRLGDGRLRLEGYLLTGCALALFYPLLTFLSGLMSLTLAAALALLAVSALVIIFLGLAVGWRKGVWRAALLLFIILGLCSLGLLTPWRGLLLTAGGLLLAGTAMFLYARRPAQAVAGDVTQASAPDRHCPACGHLLTDEYAFCPGCGRDVDGLRRCACGHEQFVPAELDRAHCIRCGKPL